MIAPEPRFMQVAIAQALKGRGRTHPNPSVGAAIVRDGVVVGRGYHKGPGTPHAEVEALREAGDLAKGGDLYVTLEPCCTFGRTPPCTSAIVSAGLARVISAVRDPNPEVCGRGSEELGKAGLEVIEGFLEEEGAAVDLPYLVFHGKRRPYVHLKWAQTLDGAVCAPGGGAITGSAARARVHADRFQSDAILVSAGTLITDDPLLTVRMENDQKTITRIVLDGKCRVTGREKVFETCAEQGGVWVVRPPGSDLGSLQELTGVEVLPLAGYDSSGAPIDGLLRLLRGRRVVSLYVEAVGRLSASFLRSGMVDKVSIHVAPYLAGGEKKPGALDGPLGERKWLELKGARWEEADRDRIVTAELEGACLPD
jgi:diaminohydroxyphosphoribosylaminopyrimidine deaminase/5-amino-6-(5-phosphoribosylamino)uracil reductase